MHAHDLELVKTVKTPSDDCVECYHHNRNNEIRERPLNKQGVGKKFPGRDEAPLQKNGPNPAKEK